MRLSVTDACNLNCSYCRGKEEHILHAAADEYILNCVRDAVSLGISDFRLTGGEPLMRKNLTELVLKIREIKGVRSLALTTNGVLLAGMAGKLKEAGIDRLNVSLDAVDEKIYERITGKNCLSRVLTGIEEAKACGIPVKLNCVILQETDPVAMAFYAQEMNLDLRFIELMPVGCAEGIPFTDCHKVRDALKEAFGMEKKLSGKPSDSGPAEYYGYEGLSIRIGYIHAMSESFCSTCSRIRMTADGSIKGCLCFDTDEKESGSLKERITAAILNKPAHHVFDRPEHIPEKRDMIEIGG